MKLHFKPQMKANFSTKTFQGGLVGRKVLGSTHMPTNCCHVGPKKAHFPTEPPINPRNVQIIPPRDHRMFCLSGQHLLARYSSSGWSPCNHEDDDVWGMNLGFRTVLAICQIVSITVSEGKFDEKWHVCPRKLLLWIYDDFRWKKGWYVVYFLAFYLRYWEKAKILLQNEFSAKKTRRPIFIRMPRLWNFYSKPRSSKK